jgi:hypothetical protein
MLNAPCRAQVYCIIIACIRHIQGDKGTKIKLAKYKVHVFFASVACNHWYLDEYEILGVHNSIENWLKECKSVQCLKGILAIAPSYCRRKKYELCPLPPTICVYAQRRRRIVRFSKLPRHKYWQIFTGYYVVAMNACEIFFLQIVDFSFFSL